MKAVCQFQEHLLCRQHRLRCVGCARGVGRPRKERAPAPEDDTPVLQTLKGGWGTLHVCDHIACQLPREEFWKAGKPGEQAPAAVASGTTGKQ